MELRVMYLDKYSVIRQNKAYLICLIPEKSSGPNMASKADMTPEEREAKEQEEFSTGPLRVLTDSVKNNTQVLINCR